MQTGNVVQEDESKVPRLIKLYAIRSYGGIRVSFNAIKTMEMSGQLQGPAALTPGKVVREFKCIWKRQN
jgi:hypothetical protein